MTQTKSKSLLSLSIIFSILFQSPPAKPAPICGIPTFLLGYLEFILLNASFTAS